MTTKPLLHDATAQRLANVISNPSHALLLNGAVGSGKGTVATWLATSLLHTDQALENHPYVTQITSDGGKAIGIEAVRELEHVLALKIPGKQAIARVVLIHDSHLLTTEAQNALLKTLEEPPKDTVIILTSARSEALLPTVRSRVQAIELGLPATTELAEALQASGVTPAEATKIMNLSGGLPGLAFALARGDESHPMVAAVQTARELLQQTTFEKLTTVDKLSKDREQSRNVVHILMQMAHASLLTGRAADRWQRIMQAAYDAEASLNRGAQPKLVLTSLMLSL